MTTKKLLSEMEVIDEITEKRTITIAVPSYFKEMIQQLIDNYADPTIATTVLGIEGTHKEYLISLFQKSGYRHAN